MTPAALELANISKRFGTVVALDDVSLVVRAGTVHALLGENGAGKTTLMHIAYGILRADFGDVRVNSRKVHLSNPIDAITIGVGMVHQHFTLVPAMTVQENLALGGTGRLSHGVMRERVRQVAQRTGFLLDPEARVESLPVGAQQRVEIAKALARDASVLILDEPTAVLAPSEIDDLLAWLREYVRAGNAAVLITHKLREAFAVADDVTVLRRGRMILTTSVGQTSVEEVSAAMIGAPAAEPRPLDVLPLGDVIFEARSVDVAGERGRMAIHAATFAVRSREIVGIAGVEGSGQRELLRALAGRLPVAAGVLRRPASVGFVPEDRHVDGVMLERSLTENVALRNAGHRHGMIPWRQIARDTDDLIGAFDVRAQGHAARMRSLSGGNQQKLVVAREMAIGSTPLCGLVVENPTRGLDVRASAEVHRRLQEAASDGAAIVMYSSDVDEILSIATRILVLHAGRVSEVGRDRGAVGRAMLGVS